MTLKRGLLTVLKWVLVCIVKKICFVLEIILRKFKCMNFKGDFIKIGALDIAPLKQAIKAITEEEWGASSWRQETFEAHVDTQTIELVFDADFRHENPTYLPKYFEFEHLLKPITQTFARYYNQSLTAKRLRKKYGEGYLVRMILVRLVPGGVISPHGDQGYSLLH